MNEAPFEFLDDDELRCLAAFQQSEVKFIVVGGYAVRAHGYLRSTGDLDLLIAVDADNLSRLQSALSSLGVLSSQEVVDLFATKPNPHWHWQEGYADHYVELLAAVESLFFDDLISSAIEVEHGELRLIVISRCHLIEVKERGLTRGGRGEKAEQDREDIAALRSGCH